MRIECLSNSFIYTNSLCHSLSLSHSRVWVIWCVGCYKWERLLWNFKYHIKCHILSWKWFLNLALPIQYKQILPYINRSICQKLISFLRKKGRINNNAGTVRVTFTFFYGRFARGEQIILLSRTLLYQIGREIRVKNLILLWI